MMHSSPKVHPSPLRAQKKETTEIGRLISTERSVREKVHRKSKHFEVIQSLNRESSSGGRGKNSKKFSVILRKNSSRGKRYGFISEYEYDVNDSNGTDEWNSDEGFNEGNEHMTLEKEAFIKDSLLGHFLFTEFTEEAIKKFICAMKMETFKANTVICGHGEVGQKFYVVLDGSVRVEENGTKVGLFKSGANFGEIALLHGCTHVKTIVAETDAELWAITRRPFRYMLQKNQNSKLLRVGQFMRKNKLFTNLNSKQIAIATEAFVLQKFEENTVIIKEGESEVDVFYILLSGTVRVTRDGSFVRDMKQGVVFGAQSLIHNESRSATCTSIGKVECYAATKTHFELVLEIPLKKAINRKELSKYKHGNTGDIAPSPLVGSRKEPRVDKRRPRKSWSDAPPQDDIELRKSSSKPRHFESVTILGRGGFGLVVLARHKRSKLPVVLKICTATTHKAYKVATREQKLLSELSHRHIVTMFNHFERRGTKETTLVLEYLQGGDLFNLLLKLKVFNFEMTRYYCASAYRALCYMHKKSIVLRDLKLENLALAPNGTLKVIDLGLATYATKKCYTMCGSPEIIAPEMISNTGYGKEIDFWALGVLVHEMAVGRAPFGDRNSYSSVHKSVVQYSRRRRAMKHRSTELASIAELLPYLSRCKQGYTTASLVYRLLHPQPSLRLGCTSHRKVDFEGHMFFQTKKWSWSLFCSGTMQPPYNPFVERDLDGPFDTSLFEKNSSQDDFAMLQHAMRQDGSCCALM